LRAVCCDEIAGEHALVAFAVRTRIPSAVPFVVHLLDHRDDLAGRERQIVFMPGIVVELGLYLFGHLRTS